MRRHAYAGLGAITLVATSLTVLVATPVPAATPTVITNTYGYTGATQTFTVPSGVSQLTLTATGGQGGWGGRDASGRPLPEGYQGVVSGTISVTPGEVLTIAVGHSGNDSVSADSCTTGAFSPSDPNVAVGGTNPLGMYNGGNGGAPGPQGCSGYGGAGGAASVLEIGSSTSNPTSVATIVAGGSGGSGGSGQFPPTLGRIALSSYTARSDTTTTNGQPGISVYAACGEPSPPGSCDGGGGAAGGGGAQGGTQGEVQFGSGSSDEWYGLGGSPGANSTGGLAGLSTSYAFFNDSDDTAGCTGSNTSGNITGSSCASSIDKNSADADGGDNGSIVISYSTGVPGAPTGVMGTAADGSVALNWTAPSVTGLTAISDYVVQFSSDGGSTWTTHDTTSTSTSTSITALTDGTSYIFEVAAVNSVGQGVFSSPSATLTPSGPPGAPTITSATPMDGAISIGFGAATSTAPILDYQYQLDGSGTWLSGGVTSSPLVISGLTNGVSHAVEIRALNAIGTGAASNSVSATPEATPGAPTITSVTTGVGSAVVNFTPGYAGGGTITGYQYQLNGGSWVDGTITMNPVNITGLTSGTTYAVAIRAVAQANSSTIYGTSSTQTNITTPNTPGAPTVNSITAGDRELTVNLTPTSNGGLTVSDYKYSTDGGSTWTSATSAGSPCTASSGGSVNCTITGLTNGTSYSVEVRAVNAVGDGASSVAQNATPITTPSAPTITSSASPYSGSALSVVFTAPASTGGSAITGYQYSTDAGATWINRTDGGGTTSPMSIDALSSDGTTALTNGTTYDIELRAVNAAGAGSASAFASGIPTTVPGAPTITSTAVSSGAITVNFTPGSNGGSAVTMYQYSTDAGSTWTTTGSLATSFSITGLTNGTTYPVTVRAVNGVGVGATSPSHDATPSTIPDQPSITSISRANVTLYVGFSVSSDGGSAISSYQYSTDAGTTWATAASNANPMVITTLSSDGTTPITNGQSYPIEIRARNANGASAPSPLTNVAPAAAPNAPTMSLTPLDQSIQVGFSITNDGGSPVNEVDYQLNGGSWVNAGTLVSPFSISGLSNGTMYTVAVRADNAIGNSAASVTSSATPRTVAYPPTSVSAVSDTASADVTWLAPTNNGGSAITGYIASAYAASSGGSAISTCTTSALSCSISGLTNGSTYYVSVVSQNAAGSSLASTPRVSVVPLARPGAPTLTGITAGDAYVSVSFTPGAAGGDPITGYQYSLNGGTTWNSASGSSSPIIITGLSDGTSYTVTLRALSAAGAGAPSTNTETATPFTYPSAVDATHIVANAENQSIVVSWLAPNANGSPITSYTATAFSALTGGSQVTTCSTGTLTCTLTGLTNNTTYYVSIQAQNAAGYSDRSAPRIAATPAYLPTAPTALVATPSDGQVVLSWTPGSTGASAISNYLIFESSGGAYTQLSTPTSTSLSTTITGLTDGASYSFKVEAVNSYGPSPLSVASATVTPLAAGTVPVATSPIPTATGFTFSLSNYSALTTYTWNATNGASVAESGANFTVSGLTTDGVSAVTVSASKYGYTTTSVIVNGSAYLSGVTPTFSATSPTATGFTFSITNFATSGTYTLSATNGATATLSSSDVTVTGIGASSSSTVTVRVSQLNHTDASATVTGYSLLTNVVPTLSAPLSSVDGFSFSITNFSTSGTYTLSATNGATATQRNGAVTVSGVSPSGTSTVTVTVHNPGHLDASATQVGSALATGVAPLLSTATPTAGGFTFSILNYSAQFTYDVTATDGATLQIDGANITVSGISASSPVTVTVTVTQVGAAPAAASIIAEALVPTTPPVTSSTPGETSTPTSTKKPGEKTLTTGSFTSTTTSATSTTTTTEIASPGGTQPTPSHPSALKLPPAAPPVGTSVDDVAGAGSISFGSGTKIPAHVFANSRFMSIGTARFGMSIELGTHGIRDIAGVVTVPRLATISVSGHGFEPGSRINVWVFSTGAHAGSTTVTGRGTFTVAAPLPSSIGIGSHTIVARGTDASRRSVSTALGIRVVAAQATAGIPASSWVSWAIAGATAIVALFVVPFAFFALRRRRDEEDPATAVPNG